MLSGSVATVPATAVTPNQTPTPVVVQAPSSLNPNNGVESALNQKIPKGSILHRIAFCESAKRQFAQDGSVLKGRVDPRDTGIFQVNSYYHLETAKQKGIDIYTVEGNIDYALDLYNREGTTPWNSSKPCWGRYLATN